MRQNTTDARYDQTRYMNFDPAMVARMAGDNFRDDQQITDRQREVLVDHYADSDARSVAEMMEEVPYWTWFGDQEKSQLGAIADMHTDGLHVQVSPEEQYECDGDADGDGDGDGVDLERIVRGVLEEYGEGDATVYARDTGGVSVQLNGAESLRDVMGDLADRYLSVDLEQDFECPPTLLVQMTPSVERAVERGDWNVEEGWDAYDDDHGVIDDGDADADGMVISIVHRDGSGVDENVRTYEQVAGGLIVEYTDESKAVYADGEVVKAWSSRDAVGDDE